MRTMGWRVTSVLLALTILAGAATAARAAEDDMTLALGGAGGVFLYAEPGELWVDVEKQDLNKRGSDTHLRAILFSPDRRVVDEIWLAEDGKNATKKPGPVQRGRLKTTVKRPGVYGVMITVTTDRYGNEYSWGFRTNCKKYLIATSRGHRDRRHTEPIVVRQPRKTGEICFRPWREKIAIDIEHLPRTAGEVALYDGKGNIVEKAAVGSDGSASIRVPADPKRGAAPWRLRLPRYYGDVQIDGVTRWQRGKPWENMSLWTPDAASWFDLHDNRWLVSPRRNVYYTNDAGTGTAALTVHNNALEKRTIDLALEFDDNKAWPITLSKKQVTLGPNKDAEVELRYETPRLGDAWTAYVRATAPGAEPFSTYASLDLRRGVAPAETGKALDTPVVLKPWQHEDVQFGYHPDYPRDNQMYFDAKNRPYVIGKRGVWHLGADGWKKTTQATPLGGGSPAVFVPRGSKIAFDTKGNAWLVATVGGKTALLQSSDAGATYKAVCELPAGGYDIEQFSGHNMPGGPPPLAHYVRTSRSTNPRLRWRATNDLQLIVPEMRPDGSVDAGTPVLVSKQCIGISMHSGIPSNIVSRGDEVHIAWAEATDPNDKTIPGVPTFVATYNRKTKKLGKASLVGYGPPANDVHNTPSITMDSKGYLHVLVGTHGRTFKYAHSLKPNTGDAGWTKPVDIGPGLRQTYVGLVCGADDTLHVVFRIWKPGKPYFPASNYACLGYMRKPAGGEWSKVKPLVVAAFSEYSIFYHRLTIDTRGRLVLSYDYWSTFWFYRNDRYTRPRTLVLSDDSGDTWRLVRDQDLQ